MNVPIEAARSRAGRRPAGSRPAGSGPGARAGRRCIPTTLARAAWALAVLAMAVGGGPRVTAANRDRQPVALIVMDPLAKELACACVRGYAQRNYHRLGTYLGKQVGRRFEVSFSEDLADAIKQLAPGQPAVVIGKQSVIEHDAASAGFKGKPLCRLTDDTGATSLTGYFVAKADDPAKRLEDLAGRRFIFGSANADEKYAAALAALKAAGLQAPAKPETRDACTEAALDVVDSTDNPPPVGVISSYALPLLEGCGSIKKGDLKIVGRTGPVPFIAVFVSEDLPDDRLRKLEHALLEVRRDPKLVAALETKDGFVPWSAGANERPIGPRAGDWPDWRGPGRDGQTSWLPDSLPAAAEVLWKRPAMNGGLAGLAVGQGAVVVADRDPADTADVFRCLEADSGAARWVLSYPARGKLDYGQFPRASPVIREGRVYLLGAFGDLHCLELKSGAVVWKTHLVTELGGRLPKWGASSTPLLVDDLLVVNPGGPQASLVGLEAATGRVRWRTPGAPAAYASFITAELGGKRQIVGYDATTLGGWDPGTGARLWTLRPETAGDFNVPTPVAVGGRLLVATENNGTRLYGFDDKGRIRARPEGTDPDLSPDTATPVVAGGRVLGSHLGLHCFRINGGLQRVWKLEDPAFEEHASLFAHGNRALVVTLGGEAILVDVSGDRGRILGRLRLFADEVEIYSHPALARDRLYVRGPTSVCCVALRAGTAPTLTAGGGGEPSRL